MRITAVKIKTEITGDRHQLAQHQPRRLSAPVGPLQGLLRTMQ
jgi:hypothetical protein